MGGTRRMVLFGALVCGFAGLTAIPAAVGVEVERPLMTNETGFSEVQPIEECAFTGVAFERTIVNTGTGNASHLGHIASSSVGAVTFAITEFCLRPDGTPGFIFRNA